MFGTDGIRGKAGDPPLDRRHAYALGVALAEWIHARQLHASVVIGMDTRESGEWLAGSVAQGLRSQKVAVDFAGVVTTPGVAYLARTEKISATQFQHLVNHESGLLGVSGISGDMRVLLEKESRDSRAADAVTLFCYQAKKWIGAYAAALGGIDTLVFAGGIGENCPSIRQRICKGLEFLGLSVDKKSNNANGAVISSVSSRGSIRVIRTDEELMIARSVVAQLESVQRNQ